MKQGVAKEVLFGQLKEAEFDAIIRASSHRKVV